MRAYTDVGEGPWSNVIYRFTDEASKFLNAFTFWTVHIPLLCPCREFHKLFVLVWHLNVWWDSCESNKISPFVHILVIVTVSTFATKRLFSWRLLLPQVTKFEQDRNGHTGLPPLWTDRQTDKTENIAFTQFGYIRERIAVSQISADWIWTHGTRNWWICCFILP